jgi:hypothetical protein
MTTHGRRYLGGLVTAVFAVSLLASCSSGPGEIAQGDLEDQIATQLAEQLKQPKPTIACPGGLEAKVGATADCTLTVPPDTKEYNVHVAVDSIDKDTNTAHYSIKVADQPNP